MPLNIQMEVEPIKEVAGETSDAGSSPQDQDGVSGNENGDYVGLGDLRLPPLCEHLQNFLVYETESKFYIVGSKEREEFRLIKIDREEPRELVSQSIHSKEFF